MKPACLAFVFALSLMTTVASAQEDTLFTYQGELKENGNLANGIFSMAFELFDAEVGGNQVGLGLSISAVSVVDGRFTVGLDLGADAFDNSDRWLEIVVEGTTISPRHFISRAPYAIQTRGIFVDEDSRVGIGTTNTLDSRLAVGGTVKGLSFELTDHSQNRIATVSSNNRELVLSNTSEGKDIMFRLWPDGGIFTLERMTLKPDGKVGIGTNTPETLLHVSGGDSLMQTITSSSAGGTWIELDNTSTGGERWGVLSTGASNGEGAGKMLLRSISDGRTVMTLQGDGNIGIGTASPVFQLQLTGNAGKPGGGPWASTSDVRLKKNIQSIEGALSTLMSLRGVTFEYIDPDAIHELPGQRIGMIAQEVEKVVPDWVDVRDDGYKTVTHRGFEALTVEALRELRAENERLHQEKDAEIGELKQQIEDLRQLKDAEISELKQQIEDVRQLVHRLMSEKE